MAALKLCVAIANSCSLPDDKARDVIPFLTESNAEFFFASVLSCFGDTDIMMQNTAHLAIPTDYPFPTRLPAAEFASCGTNIGLRSYRQWVRDFTEVLLTQKMHWPREYRVVIPCEPRSVFPDVLPLHAQLLY